MENASKALIMAGAVLIAILIISLSVLVYKNFSGSVKDSANMDEQEVANFNSKISPYLGDNVSGSQVNALIQLVVSINNSAISTNELGKSVSITYPSTGGNNTLSANSGGLRNTNDGATRRVETGSGKYYKVQAGYGSNGLINQITVN